LAVSEFSRDSSRKNVGDGDPAGESAFDDYWHILTASKELARIVAGRSRIGVDFDATMDQIHDPKHRDAAVSVGIPFLALITVKGRFGDLNHERDVLGLWNSGSIIIA
jgi:hypothetical protein